MVLFTHGLGGIDSLGELERRSSGLCLRLLLPLSFLGKSGRHCKYVQQNPAPSGPLETGQGGFVSCKLLAR